MPERFDAREVTYGGTRFTINRMPALVAKPIVIAHVRPMFAAVLASGAAVRDVGGAIRAVLTMPSDHYDATVAAMYRYIRFRAEGQQAELRLADDPELAFANCDVAHIFALDARAMAVNFTESWSVIDSELKRLNRDLPSAEPQT